MKKLNLILIYTIILILKGCHNGYTKIKNEWYYVEYNEATGKVTKKLNNIDIKTFVVLNEYFAKDQYNAFYKGRLIENSNGKFFKIIDNKYSKDKHHVFLFNYSLPNADPNSFYVIGGLCAKDSNFVYIGNIPFAVSSKVNNIKIIKKGSKITLIDANEFLKHYPKLYDNFKKIKHKPKVIIYDNSVCLINDKDTIKIEN